MAKRRRYGDTRDPLACGSPVSVARSWTLVLLVICALDPGDQRVGGALDGVEVAFHDRSILRPPGDIGKGVAAGIDPVMVEHHERHTLGHRLGIFATGPAPVIGYIVRRFMGQRLRPLISDQVAP